MKPNFGSGARNSGAAEQIHLLCSSGGSRAILGSAGAIAALDQAGLKDFVSLGGISGGSIPTAMYAAGLGATETLHLAIEIDFSSMLTRHGSILRILFAYLMQGRFAQTRPRKGVFSSEKLGKYLDEKVPVWPARYWTMAVQGVNMIFFTSTGVFQLTPEGKRTVISDKPAPLGLAIRASCAVPGIISAVPYKGRFLFDGALTYEGRCPIVLPVKYKGAQPESLIVVDAGDDLNKWSLRLTRLWGLLCGGNCIPYVEENVVTENDVGILVKPDLGFFRSLQFTLTRDQKWRAVMAGYVDTVKQLRAQDVIRGEILTKMEIIVAAYERIESMCKFSEEGVLARLTEQLMVEHKLF